MSTLHPAQQAGRILHRPVGTGAAFWGPGDHYTFLVTGEDTGGAYFVMEALVPPGGGPPPHIHTREDETYYILDGHIETTLGDQTTVAGPGDFVNIPRDTLHCFRNTGTETARMILTFVPAGIEAWFLECLEPAPNAPRPEDVPDNAEEVAARYVAAAPRHGLVFV